MPNGDFARFDGSLPVGWQLIHSGAAQYSTTLADGYVAGKSLELNVHDYRDGDTTLQSPKVSLQQNMTYLFKGYYKTTVPFELLARYYHTDGSSALVLVQSYPGDSSDWSTASDAFASTNITAVQFVYRVSGNGQLSLNGLYLEPQHDIYVPPTVAGQNLIPNSRLATSDASNIPQDWSTYHVGDNNAEFTYEQDPAGAYLQTTAVNYHTGEAKWQYAEQTVHADQYFQFSADVRSTVPTPIVAEYVMQDNTRKYETVATAQPADSWTTVSCRFEVPPGAQTLYVSMPLHRSGTIATRSYQLIDISGSGSARWNQPLVSITFDDGWESSFANALPILKQYNYASTFYINPAAIETPNFMTAQNLSQLKGSGNEIAAHGYEHADMTAISQQELNYQLHQGRDYLRKAGYTTTDFATPYGRSDPEVQWYARHYFTTLRSTSSGINTRQNFDPYDLQVFYVTNTTTPADIQAALQSARAYNGWLIFVYHQIGDSTPPYGTLPVERSATSVATFRTDLHLIQASGIQVLPVSQAYQTITTQEHS